MKIKIAAFGYLAEIVNTAEIEVEAGTDVLALKIKLEIEFPALKNYEYKIAVNQELVNENVIIDEHSEIVLLPAFAGG